MNDELPTIRMRRMHALSPLLNLDKWFSWLIISGITVLVLGQGVLWQSWLIGFFAITIVYEVYRYFTTSYVIAADEIIVRTGLLFRGERHIPFSRIQNISLVQNALHRTFKVAVVRLETAGGAKPEAIFRVLHVREVENMRSRVFAQRQTPPPIEETTSLETAMSSPEASNLVVQIPTSDLVRLGLVNNRGWALIAILFGFAWQFDLWEHWDEWERWQQWMTMFNLEWNPQEWSTPLVVGMSLLGTIALMMVIYLFSIIWTIARFHGFTIRRDGDDLQLNCGLLTRRSATIHRHRVQFISIHESIMHRVFDRVTIRIETASGQEMGEADAEVQHSQKWFLPIVPKSEVPRILEELQPGLTLPAEESWLAMSPVGRRRYRKKFILLALLITLVLGLAIFRPWGLLSGLVLVPLALWHCRRASDYLGWTERDGQVFFRSGAWVRKLSVTFDATSQVPWMSQSPFDRKHDHARLRLDTAGAGPAGHRISIPYLDAHQVRAKLNQFAKRLEAANMRW